MNSSNNARPTNSPSSKAKRVNFECPNKSSVTERRYIATPRSDLIVVKVGENRSKRVVRDKEKASFLVSKIVKATSKPGTNRKTIFNSRLGKRVYAYSVCPKDTNKIIREDSSGKVTVGRFANGSFRVLTRFNGKLAE
jgi:hypothetical protein